MVSSFLRLFYPVYICTEVLNASIGETLILFPEIPDAFSVRTGVPHQHHKSGAVVSGSAKAPYRSSKEAFIFWIAMLEGKMV
jgi:hypothetical protein